MSVNPLQFGQLVQTPQLQGIMPKQSDPAFSINQRADVDSAAISKPELNPFGQLRPVVQSAERANKLDLDA